MSGFNEMGREENTPFDGKHDGNTTGSGNETFDSVNELLDTASSLEEEANMSEDTNMSEDISQFEGGEDEFESGGELALESEDDALPWLESSEYEDEDESVNPASIIGFVLTGLVLLALILGLFWWLSNRDTSDPDLVADGSTIEAPKGPTKVRPDNEGGKVFEGTGNVAPIVGEGQTSEGQIDGGDAARPSVDTATSENTPTNSAANSGANSSANSGANGAAATAGSSGGVGVQVGAYKDRRSAETGWANFTRRSPALKGLQHRVLEGQADIGRVYRLQAVAKDEASAQTLCSTLKSQGIDCQVKR